MEFFVEAIDKDGELVSCHFGQDVPLNYFKALDEFFRMSASGSYKSVVMHDGYETIADSVIDLNPSPLGEDDFAPKREIKISVWKD